MRTLVPWLLVSVALAQSQDPFVIQSTTKLVTVSVIALDKKGNPVEDLKESDFVLTEAGKAQKIAAFEVLRSGSQGTTSNGAAPGRSPNVFSNRATDTSVSAGVTVILLDYLNTPWADLIQSKARVLRFLSTIRREDRIAIYALTSRLLVLHDFTSDALSLAGKLERARNSSGPFLNIGMEASSAWPVEPESVNRTRVERTLKAMEAIANHIAGVPGRKSIVWVSGGFPIVDGWEGLKEGSLSAVQRSYGTDVYRTTRALNDAGVAIYPLDARGLMPSPILGASQRGEAIVPGTASTWTPPNLDSMSVLASRTGGRAFYNNNDLDGAIRSVLNENKSSYVLGYYSAGEADGRYREIKVSVARPGVTLRHRKGYVAAPSRTGAQSELKQDMARSLSTPMDSTVIGLTAQVEDDVGAGEIQLAVRVDPAHLPFDKEGERWKGSLDIAIVQRSMDASTYHPLSERVQLRLTDDRLAALRQSGLMYKKSVPRHAATSVVRIVVRDGATGAMGTLTVPMRTQAPAASASALH